MAKVSYGFGKVATALGEPCEWYRPTGAMDPLGTGNLVGNMQAFITNAASLAPATPGHDTKSDNWYGALDVTRVHAGDLLRRPAGDVFFVAVSGDDFTPARLVRCNHTADIYAAPAVTGLGEVSGYGGDVRAAEQLIARGWPCATSPGTKSGDGDAKLPSDMRQPYRFHLFPLIPGAALAHNMRVVMDDGDEFLILDAALSFGGWRCVTILATS